MNAIGPYFMQFFATNCNHPNEGYIEHSPVNLGLKLQSASLLEGLVGDNPVEVRILSSALENGRSPVK
jgi:hypothetical protein